MSVAELRSLPLVFVQDLQVPEILERDLRHLRASLRLRDGASIAASDGRGSYRLGLLGTGFEPISEVRTIRRPHPRVAIGLTPVKAIKTEWMIQKLTELGVDCIQPLLADRSVVRLDRKKRVSLDNRLARAAREAAMQCKRVWLPDVESPRSVADAVTKASADGLVVGLADPAGRSFHSPDGKQSSLVLVGPEGGWSQAESELAPLVGLPGHILRTETAVVAAAVLACESRWRRDLGEAI